MKRKHSRRERLELAIEKAIALLDQIDGDPDLEPSLSSSTCVGAGGGINRLVSPDTAFFAQHFDGGSRWSQENWVAAAGTTLRMSTTAGSIISKAGLTRWRKISSGGRHDRPLVPRPPLVRQPAARSCRVDRGGNRIRYNDGREGSHTVAISLGRGRLKLGGVICFSSSH